MITGTNILEIKNKLNYQNKQRLTLHRTLLTMHRTLCKLVQKQPVFKTTKIYVTLYIELQRMYVYVQVNELIFFKNVILHNVVLAAIMYPSLILHSNIYRGGLQFHRISTVTQNYFDALPCFSNDIHLLYP